MDLFGEYKPTLTSLRLGLTDVNPRIAEKWFQSVGNLKELVLSLTTPQINGSISLKSLTALERLTLNEEAQIHDISSSRLTSLELWHTGRLFNVEKEVSKLTNLKHFSASLKQDEDENVSYEWLNPLTALEQLHFSGTKQSNFLHFAPTKLQSLHFSFKSTLADPSSDYEGLSGLATSLTSLLVAIDRPVELSHLSRLVLLKDLVLQCPIDPDQDTSVFSQMTQLNQLQIGRHKFTSACKISFSSALMNLTHLSLSSIHSCEIALLTNLESLSLFRMKPVQCNGIDSLVRLTKLVISDATLTEDEPQIDFSFVSSLTTLKSLLLKTLGLELNCKHLTALATLERLEFDKMTDEADYWYLSQLTKLTELTGMR